MSTTKAVEALTYMLKVYREARGLHGAHTDDAYSVELHNHIASLRPSPDVGEGQEAPAPSALVEAGNAMCYRLEYTERDDLAEDHIDILLGQKWRAALSKAQPASSSSPLGDAWIPVTEDDQPERNTPAIYWHKPNNLAPGGMGFPAIADEWRWEHHAKSATHWLKYNPPQPITTNS